MGNCQAAEAATVIIQRPPPNNKIQRIYWSVTANEIMNSNPGHYVAIILTSKTHNGNQLKLLRPHDSLLIGHVYRLVSFEGSLSSSFFVSISNLHSLQENRCFETEFL